MNPLPRRFIVVYLRVPNIHDKTTIQLAIQGPFLSPEEVKHNLTKFKVNEDFHAYLVYEWLLPYRFNLVDTQISKSIAPSEGDALSNEVHERLDEAIIDHLEQAYYQPSGTWQIHPISLS